MISVTDNNTAAEFEAKEKSEPIIYRIEWFPREKTNATWYAHSVKIVGSTAIFKDIQDDDNPVAVNGSFCVEVVDEIPKEESDDS